MVDAFGPLEQFRDVRAHHHDRYGDIELLGLHRRNSAAGLYGVAGFVEMLAQHVSCRLQVATYERKSPDLCLGRWILLERSNHLDDDSPRPEETLLATP